MEYNARYIIPLSPLLACMLVRPCIRELLFNPVLQFPSSQFSPSRLQTMGEEKWFSFLLISCIFFAKRASRHRATSPLESRYFGCIAQILIIDRSKRPAVKGKSPGYFFTLYDISFVVGCVGYFFESCILKFISSLNIVFLS
jgi:hypothetical protein